MKKLYLQVAAMLMSIVAAHAQISTQDTAYRSRKLKLDEVNFVSSYYSQDGNHSAVTGGIGTEKLTDFANTFELQLSRYSRNGKKNSYTFELGIDHYSSASSDKIDPATVSSASSADTRIYPSLDWTRTNEKTGNSFGFTASYSGEYDYQSIGGAFHMSRQSKGQNTQFDWRVQAFLDTWTVILPVELRGINGEHSGSSPRNSFSSSFSLSQVINKRLQAELILEPAYQHGLLATRYQRNYFTDGSLQAETLPSDRYKLPVALRLNYFLADRFILRTFYRYYLDSWGIRAHTAELETPVKLSPFLSVSPFYRYSQQSGARYFAPYGQHQTGERYFTSDYDLSGLNSNFFGAGIRIVPPKGVLGWQRLNALELRYGHYLRSNSLASNIFSLNLKFR